MSPAPSPGDPQAVPGAQGGAHATVDLIGQTARLIHHTEDPGTPWLDLPRWARKEYRARARAGLRAVEAVADAWDEGYADGLHDAHEHRPGRQATNPYTRSS